MECLYEVIKIAKELNTTTRSDFVYKGYEINTYLKSGYETNNGWQYSKEICTINVLCTNEQIAKELCNIFSVFFPNLIKYKNIQTNIGIKYE